MNKNASNEHTDMIKNKKTNADIRKTHKSEKYFYLDE